MNNLEFSNQSVGSLVARRPNGQFISSSSLFCTISPNPNTKVKCLRGRKTIAMKYCLLPHKVQYQYCIRVLKACYMQFLTPNAEIIGTWELNKMNNVHLHFIINDPQFKSDQRFNTYRRDISCCSLVVENRSKKTNNDYMNSIVRVTKSQDDILDYLDKDYEKDPILPNYYSLQTSDPNIEIHDVKYLNFDEFCKQYYQNEEVIL